MFASFNASSENIGKVTWSPNRLNIEVEQGDEKHIGVLTSSSERLTDLSVQIVPELKGLLTTEPVNLKEQGTSNYPRFSVNPAARR